MGQGGALAHAWVEAGPDAWVGAGPWHTLTKAGALAGVVMVGGIGGSQWDP